MITRTLNQPWHVTAVGHSYGSLTVGQASQQPGGIPADDIVLLGSPGVGVDKASDLGVGRDHVFVGAADNDPVSRAPSPKKGAAGLLGTMIGGPPGGLLAYELVGDDDKNWFGQDPASEGFGARRFRVNDGPRPVIHGDPFPAHSGYFDPDRDPYSARNIGVIVAGHPEKSQRRSRDEVSIDCSSGGGLGLVRLWGDW
ncbi:alpha/beta hydrolase [Streptomyces sp. NPDC051173]|uniref:alpha/beta hydrolase n=1 Tax=Streptomyces sp. NPDC051173 TaxID=3155164 RepID=UPI00344CE09C